MMIDHRHLARSAGGYDSPEETGDADRRNRAAIALASGFLVVACTANDAESHGQPNAAASEVIATNLTVPWGIALGSTWGATEVERAASLPCDDLAPYSYDVLDNTGRRSPSTRSAELTDLAVGQRVVRIFGRAHVFELAAFSANEHITLRQRDFGRITRIATCSTPMPSIRRGAAPDCTYVSCSTDRGCLARPSRSST